MRASQAVGKTSGVAIATSSVFGELPKPERLKWQKANETIGKCLARRCERSRDRRVSRRGIGLVIDRMPWVGCNLLIGESLAVK